MTTALNTHLFQMLDDAFTRLSPLLGDATIREIMVNGEDNVWIERSGRMERYETAFSEREAGNAIRILATLADREMGAGHSVLLDASLSGLRISAVMFPVATRGHALCIRKHAGVSCRLEDYAPDGASLSVSTAAADPAGEFRFPGGLGSILKQWIETKKNVLVSGGTSTGKTTFLNAMIRAMSPEERLVVIEDTRELTVELPNFVSFEAHEGHGVTVRDLVRQTLRFRPDRIVVGEVRGGEAFDLLQAMNTGHAGCLGTLHANSAQDALYRLEQMVMQSGIDWPSTSIARQIAGCIDGVIHLGRVGGARRIVDVVRVEGHRDGAYQTRSLFQAA
ncbi:MAG: CpaF family protein [Betaproteobacteria bacterium]|nr:CpaF family protein [Betaproteobacteria bacterium]MDE2132646.1 CpaF family protein [Betaproteobacteria bacterium]MDE2353486.1 CpaF family protein [Betaproteobacteria bacterium]